MTLRRGDGVRYELRSRKILATAASASKSSRPELKRRRNTDPPCNVKNKKKKLPWWVTRNTNGKPVEGWLVRCYRSSTSWFVNSSRLPAKWGPYILPNCYFDNKTYQSDKDAFAHGLVPLVTPSERIIEAQKLAESQPTECAETALAYYNENKRMGTDFTLVKALELNVFVCGGIWFHINFEAKAQDAHCTEPTTNLFFAELTLADPNKMEVTACVSVALESDFSGGIGCTFCRFTEKRICHPAQGFERGLTSIGVEKPACCHPSVSADGTFDFEGWYERTYQQAHRPEPPRRPAQERKEDKEASHHQNIECAKTALTHYNKETGKHFELVEAVHSGAFIYRPPPLPGHVIWYHVNFKARPRIADHSDSSPKLFFAEICRGNEKEVTLCTILEREDCGDCKFCGPACHRNKMGIRHPVHGYHGCLPANNSGATGN